MPPEDDTRGSLEHARERLYTPNAHLAQPDASLAHHGEGDVPHEWQEEPPKRVKPHRHVRYALMFFWTAFAFFLIACGVAAYLFLSGNRTVSTDRVAIAIQGPTTVAGGDTATLQISVTNNNPAPITGAKLTLAFPTGTRSASNVLTSLSHETEDLGTIAPGAHVDRTVKAVLFGAQGQNLKIPVTLQFQTPGSNATFVKKYSYAVSVVATPLSVSIDVPPETVPGQPMTLTATVRSNATKALSGVVLEADYPVGFTPTQTSVTPVGNDFPLGTLAPGASKVVHITGTLTGQDGQQRVFVFKVGTADNSSDTSIAVKYMQQSSTVAITKPFIQTKLAVNGSSSNQAVISAGTHTTVSLSWVNTLNVPITNAQISVSLSGNALDPSSITSGNGQYQSATKTVVFNRDTDPSLASLAPGAQGVGSFSFAPFATTTVMSPTVVLTVSVSGQRPGQGSVSQAVTASLSKTIKVATDVSLDGYALFATGPFSNSGPVPPVANHKTTYTVVWVAHNTSSDVAGATVNANLPTDVQFVGPVQPQDGSVVYHAGSHSITWSIGDLPANASKKAAFQVAVTPSTSQRGKALMLSDTASLSGFDRFSQINVSATARPVTTRDLQDPGLNNGSGTVQ